MPQWASFTQSSHEVHVLKVASDISIVDIVIFYNHPTFGLSSIYSNSQDDWSCDSESTYDSNLDNWEENSKLFDETFSSLLSSISRFQPLLGISSSNLHHNSPDSNLHLNDAKL